MTALNTILKEVDHLQDHELHVLIHILVDKIHIPPEVSAKPVESPFRKYRGRAKGVWQQDAQTYRHPTSVVTPLTGFRTLSGVFCDTNHLGYLYQS